LGRAPEKKSKKKRQAARPGESNAKPIGQRWRTTGLVKKDQLVRLLESNGAHRNA
jgi:hypothetical protein